MTTSNQSDPRLLDNSWKTLLQLPHRKQLRCFADPSSNPVSWHCASSEAAHQRCMKNNECFGFSEVFDTCKWSMKKPMLFLFLMEPVLTSDTTSPDLSNCTISLLLFLRLQGLVACRVTTQCSFPAWAPAPGSVWSRVRSGPEFESFHPGSVRPQRGPPRGSAAGRGHWNQWQSTCCWLEGACRWCRSGRRCCSHRNLPTHWSPEGGEQKAS